MAGRDKQFSNGRISDVSRLLTGGGKFDYHISFKKMFEQVNILDINKR